MRRKFPKMPRLTTRTRKTDWWSAFAIRRLLMGLVATALAFTTSLNATAQGLDEAAATGRFCRQGPDAAVARGRGLVAAAEQAERDVWPNPKLVAGHERVFGAEGENETVVGLEVTLGTGGRRFLLQDVAAARRAQRELEVVGERLQAALAFRRAFVRAAADRARLAVKQRRLGAYAALLAKLRRLQKGGESARYDARRLQLQAQLGAAEVARLQAQSASQRVWLQTVLGAAVDLDGSHHAWAGGRRPALREGEHPRVATLRAGARVSALQARAERRRWVPELDLFAGYRNVAGATRDVRHGFSFSLGVPLTFFDHGQGQARRAEAEGVLARARAERAKRYLKAERARAATRLQSLEAGAGRLAKVLQAARKLARDAERLYLADEAQLLDVLAAQRQVLAAELSRIESAAAIAEARLALMGASGRWGEPRLQALCGGRR